MGPLITPVRLLRLGWRARLAWLRRSGRSPSVDMTDLTGFYETVWASAAAALSARMTELSPGVWRLERGANATVIHNYVVQIDDPVILNLAGDKALCHRLLMDRGLPVPAHLVFSTAELDAAERFMTGLRGEFFVVKPAASTSGARGVTTHVDSPAELRSAAALASLYGERILIERWVPGESYRLLFLDDELIHASRRRGWRVRGDGASTVGRLIAARTGARGVRRTSSRSEERDRTATLEAQGLQVDSVPERGRTVLVQSVDTALPTNVEMRTVFDEDATADIGPALRDQAARAVRAIGSRFAGVDIITLDPSRPLERSGGAINEINTTPGLHHHYYQLAGVGHGTSPAVRVLARLLGTDIHSASELAYAGSSPSLAP
jgi:cyanophycin synthetase